MELNSGMDVSGFLEEWNSPSETVLVHTSGSTGEPKPMPASKSRMLASARITCDFLKLSPGDSALLCLPLEYIAGKMMVVRSIERGLELTSVKPCNHPLAGLDSPFDLVAMVPSQVFCSLLVPDERELLAACRNLIIGGGAVSEELVRQLEEFPNAVWSTYGMTETLSHIALRRLNGPERSEWYTPFDSIRLNADENSCLCIDAPVVCEGILHTRDIVEFAPDARRFRILGRLDNVICCGGVKLQIERIESQLGAILGDHICVTRRSDPKFGEVPVLLVERDACTPALVEEAVSALEKFSRPKDIVYVDSIPRTGNGKIRRR